MIRVTQVLDYLVEPELLNFMLKSSPAKRERVSKDALAVGTIVDLMVQHDLGAKIGLPEVPEEHKVAVYNCVAAWDVFKGGPEKFGAPAGFLEGIKAIQTELVDGELVGHPDIEYEDDERWGIVDVKSSRAIYPKYWTQTAKYSAMRQKMTPRVKPRFTAILRLDKETGRPHYSEIADEGQILYEEKVFDAHLFLFNHNRNVREFIRQQLELEVLGVK